jgi:hypothetical protein
MSETSVAVLWDAENVNPKSLKSLVEAVLEFAGRFGRVSVAYAFGDWKRSRLTGADSVLAGESFQLMHVPAARKNSADISMVTSAMELLFLYPHVSTYVLVTGDSDFRPLLVSIRRRGAQTAVVCDARSASEDLLALADEYRDYRDLLADEETPATEAEEEGMSLTREQAFQLLSEAVSMMRQNKKTPGLGPVKIRMKLLHEGFDESKLGYRSWKSFVQDAQKQGYVNVETKGSDLILALPKSRERGTERLAEPFHTFLETVVQCGGAENASDGISLAKVGNALNDRNFDYRKYGYKKLSKLAEAAGKRGLADTSNRNLEWTIKLTPEGARYVR